MTSPAMIIISATSCLEGESDMDSGSTSTSTCPSGERRTYTCDTSRLPHPALMLSTFLHRRQLRCQGQPMIRSVWLIAQHPSCMQSALHVWCFDAACIQMSVVIFEMSA